MNSCRISFTQKIPGNQDTFQIAFSSLFMDLKTNKNVFVAYSDEDVYDCLSKIMEKYDTLESFHIYCEDLEEIFKFLIFLREENPKKTINVNCFRSGESNDEDMVDCDVINYLNYIK